MTPFVKMRVVSSVKPNIPPNEAHQIDGGYPLYVGHGFHCEMNVTGHGHHERHVSPLHPDFNRQVHIGPS